MVGNWHTLAGRLRWAIFEHQPPQGRERGLRLFQRRMEAHAPDTPGTSLSAIQGYLRGEPEPSLRFIEEAARLLGVRGEWLAWGAGAPTEEEEAIRRETPEEELAQVCAAVYGALGIPDQGFGRATEVWAPAARQAAIAYWQARHLWVTLTGEGERLSRPEATEAIAAAIAAPLEALVMDPLRVDDLPDYVQAIALAIHRTLRRYYPTSPGQEADDAEG